jgi:hypothetical protein
MAKYGNHGPQKDTRAVNWADVTALIKALELEYGGLVKITMDCEGASGRNDAMWIRASLYSGWADQSTRPSDVMSALWPTNASRTMAGLVFRLLHQLDHAAEARRKAESEDLPF